MVRTQLVRDTLCTTMHAKRTYEKKNTKGTSTFEKKKKKKNPAKLLRKLSFSLQCSAMHKSVFFIKQKKDQKRE